jgi:hypothetical protein
MPVAMRPGSGVAFVDARGGTSCALPVFAALVALAAAAAGCGAPPGNARPASPLEVRYRLVSGSRGTGIGGASGQVATAIYRGWLARALFSDCSMVPRDSEAFDRRLARCGPVAAVMVSMSRLLLEEAAGPAYLTPVRMDRRLRWVDVPMSCASR